MSHLRVIPLGAHLCGASRSATWWRSRTHWDGGVTAGRGREVLEDGAGLGFRLWVDLEGMAPDRLLQPLLMAERVVLGQHRQLEKAQLVAHLPQLGGDVAQLPHARTPLRGPHRAKELDLLQREQQLFGECLLRLGQQPPDLLRVLGDDLLDPTALDLAVQRRRQQMALADPVALELGPLAERLGSFTPEVRVEAALGVAELQGGVVVLAFPLPNPDDDAAAQQRQLSGVVLSPQALSEPDAPPFGLGETDAECLATAFDHRGPERHLDLHPIDPGWKRAPAVGRHGTVIAQRRLPGNLPILAITL